jgi:hypothetical protein
MKPIKERIKIVVGCDDVYFTKATELWKSLLDVPYEVYVLCLGFAPSESQKEKYNFNYATADIYKLKSYIENYPDNRPFFVCVESGEFLDYFGFEDDDIIVHIDADGIIQREFNEDELKQIESLEYGDVWASYSSYPPRAIQDEWNSLLPKTDCPIEKDQTGSNPSIYCMGMIVCSVKTYRSIYGHYLRGIDYISKNLRHHASGQWLLNYIIHDVGGFKNSGNLVQNAEWFNGSNTKEQNGKLLALSEKTNNYELVFFNHTKFNPKYYYGNRTM